MSNSEDATEPPIQDPGAQLRRKREAAGVSLQNIADQTLISVFRLQALEDQDFGRVGGAAYVTGYARSYAKVIGVDSAPYVQAFEAMLSAEAREEEALVADTLRPPRRTPSPVAIAVAVLTLFALLAAAIGLWQWISSDGDLSEVRDTSVAPQMERPSMEAAEPTSTANVAPPTTVVDGAGESPEGESDGLDAQPVLTTQEVSEDTEVMEIGDGQTLPSPEQNEEVLESATDPLSREVPDLSEELAEDVQQAELRLSFRDECWVEVTDADGSVLMAQVAQAGDDFQLTGTAPFDIVLGNARAADIVLNGAAVRVPVRAGRNTSRFTIGTS